MIKAIAFALLLAAAPAASAQTVFLVRHAERADGGASAPGADPELSAAGAARADALAVALKDAGIAAIFVTEFKRTQQTAAPLARALGLTVTVVPAKDADALAEKLRGVSGAALVVGHSNTVPGTIKALGVDAPTIGDDDYDNLFVVRMGEKPSMIRLHYR